jgi:hypothetical protein
MEMKLSRPEAAVRMLDLAQRPYRPKEIQDLAAAIESETRVAELRLSVTGDIDEDHIKKIVEMKLRLDILYTAWAEGEIC